MGEEGRSVKGEKCGRTYRRMALTLSPQSVLTSFGLGWPQISATDGHTSSTEQ
jgi:hypothetical protein